jgi:hypothetical protein
VFDRNRTSEGPISVEITLHDGRELRGRLTLPPGRTLTEVLNGSATFVDFEPFGSERTYLAKSALHAIRPLELPSAPSLGGGRRSSDAVDPFAVLGVPADAGKDEVRQAYLRLAKVYHPDRYSMAELPKEVREYLSGMAQRVNAAYDAVEAARQRKAARSEPVFTTSASR